MRKNLIAVLIAFLSLPAFADTLDLGEHGRLSVTVPKDWKFFSQAIPGKGFAAALRPISGANAGIKLSIIYLPESKAIDRAKLRSDLLKQCEQFVDASVEKTKTLRDFALARGYGQYCVFTDASLVGKPEKKGDFKIIAPGVVQLTDDVLIVVTMVADDANGPEFQAMLESLSSLDLQKSP